MSEADVCAALEVLRKEWFVELSSTPPGWRLMLTKRAGGYCAHVFNGAELGEVVARAARGDRPDFRSR